MPGQPFRLTTFSGDDINIGVSVVTPGKSDPGAVRREMRKVLDARMRSQPADIAPVEIRHPEIICISERDVILAHRRISEHASVMDIDAPGPRREEIEE